MAKKTQEKPKTRVHQQPQTLNETMATLCNPQLEKKPNSYRGQRKTQLTSVAITAVQHPQAHNTHNPQCNGWRTYTSRKGERTNSQPVRKGKMKNIWNATFLAIIACPRDRPGCDRFCGPA